jgi:hypothetical protein
MDEINKSLDELILNEIKEANQAEASKEKQDTIEGIVKLYKARQESEKNLNDADVKMREVELKEHEAQIKEADTLIERDREDHDKLVRTVINGVEFAVPIMVYILLYRKGLKFEETGVFSSTTFRGLLSKFKPFKKL